MPNAPVENKVKTATVAGAGSAGVITPFVIWGVDQLFFNGGAGPDVPLPVVGVLGLVVTGACTFAGGWYGKHTARPADRLAGRPSPSGDAAAAAGSA